MCVTMCLCVHMKTVTPALGFGYDIMLNIHEYLPCYVCMYVGISAYIPKGYCVFLSSAQLIIIWICCKCYGTLHHGWDIMSRIVDLEVKI